MSILKFDADLFDSMLDAAATPTGGSGSKGGYQKKVRNKFLKHPGIRFSVASSGPGGLAYKKANKKGVLIDKVAKAIRGVVLNSEFAMAQWGKENGAAKMLCSSISHTNPDGSAGEGSWQIPLGAVKLTDTLNPQGFKGKSCRECIDNKENEGCKQSGALHILVTGLDHGETDENDDFIGIQDVEPFVAHINAGGMSAFQYTNYLLELRRIPGKPNPDTIQAVFSTQDNPKAPVKMLKIEVDKAYSDVAGAQELYKEELAKMAIEEQKRLDEWKAKNGIGAKGSNTPKKSVDEDDLPF